jgi:hypothetical protein
MVKDISRYFSPLFQFVNYLSVTLGLSILLSAIKNATVQL